MKNYDVVVIGAGPGGYTASIRVAQLGGSVCVVEKAELGGTCTNLGCVPTKALGASAHMFEQIQTASDMGVLINGEPSLDFAKVASRRNKIVKKIRDGIGVLLKAQKVDVIKGYAHLASTNKVIVERESTSEISAKNIILACGSEPGRFPFVLTDTKRVVTSDGLVCMSEKPKSMVIIGGGVIGCEFASIYRTFGVEVTVVELLPYLISNMDPVLSKELQRLFRKAGIQVYTQTSVRSIETTPQAQTVELALSNGKRLNADLVLVACGRTPVTSGLGLEKIGVKLKNGYILTDDRMATSVDNIYAIGDAVGKTMLAHTAIFEGEVAGANAMGENEHMHYHAVPAVVFTLPEIATVGLGPAQAKKRGLDVNTGKFFYNACAKAQCDNVAYGKVEILADKESGRILGGWVVGSDAGTLIAEITMAVSKGLSSHDLCSVIHAHPTLPEIVLEATADTVGMSIHRASFGKRS